MTLRDQERGEALAEERDEQRAANMRTGKQWRPARVGIGQPFGMLTLADGSRVDGGRMLMRDQWNTQLHGELATAYREGCALTPPDVLLNKESHPGFWSGRGCRTEVAEFLELRGITTLLFAGVNTDQCVLGTVQDAALAGYDTVLLRDACGTTSPDYAQRMVDFNCERTFGFQTTGDELLEAASSVDWGESQEVDTTA